MLNWKKLKYTPLEWRIKKEIYALYRDYGKLYKRWNRETQENNRLKIRQIVNQLKTEYDKKKEQGEKEQGEIVNAQLNLLNN